MKEVVIIGGGYAGVLTAKKLAKRVKKREDVKITLIDRNPFHTMLTELHEVAAGRVEDDSVKISLSRVFAGRNVQVVQDTAESVDFAEKTVVGRNGRYPYTHLVLTAGSRPMFFGVPGAAEYAFQLWSYQDAVVLREQIHTMFQKAALETDERRKKQMLTFYVVGAGFTGVEMAGELAEYVPILCDRYEIDRELVTLCNVDILKRPVPILPEKLSIKTERRLEKMGVSVQMETGVVAIGRDYIETKSGDKITRTPANTVIWTAGIEAGALAAEAAKTLPAEGRSRIVVEETLQVPGYPEVYAAGDNMYYIPGGTGPDSGQRVPQTVENCEQSSHVVAHNLAVSITGQGEPEAYRPAFHGYMVSIGGRYGVARVGLPGHMINLPSFLAMFTKHFINVVYFIQVLGWNKVFSYLRHEFFTIRNCRSFLGGHFSNRTPSFLLVPLRLWLGGVWVFEGVRKIVENWFTTPMLTGFFGGANAWFDRILYGIPPTGAADAVTSATGMADAVGGAADAVSSGVALFSYRILGLFDAIFVCGKDPAAANLSDYAFKLNIPLVNWFVDKVILPNDGVQIFMQASIVVVEIAIGLAIAGGLFTTPASAVSLVLQVMFVSTTGLYLETFWMIFAAIAVLIGAGRTLGLDYYAMPFLKNGWKRIGWVRKWYLYHD